MSRERVSWWAIAWRNLVKNPRRTGFTVAAIALGYGAITTFGGFTSYIFSTIREAQIYAQADGHLTILKPGYFDEAKAEPEDRFLTTAEVASVRAALGTVPGVKIVSTQMQFKGLISNGNISTIFVGAGKVWSDVYRIRAEAKGVISRIKLFDGDYLKDDVPTAIAIGRGLSQKLGLPIGSRAIVVGSTLDGQINALDVEVVQITDAPSVLLEGMLLIAPLGFTQTLLDGESVDRVSILLEPSADLTATRSRVEAALAAAGIQGLWVRTWREMDPMYPRTEAMFSVIFLFVFSIILVISVLIVINTTTMATLERTREIGTLRALGVKRRGIVALFARESFLMSLLGSSIGAGLTIAAWYAVRIADLEWTPPTVSRPIPLVLDLVPSYFAIAAASMVAIAMFAALWPARRAARASIVDSLGHA